VHKPSATNTVLRLIGSTVAIAQRFPIKKQTFVEPAMVQCAIAPRSGGEVES
jgi:hypothetical protein